MKKECLNCHEKKPFTRQQEDVNGHHENNQETIHFVRLPRKENLPKNNNSQAFIVCRCSNNCWCFNLSTRRRHLRHSRATTRSHTDWKPNTILLPRHSTRANRLRQSLCHGSLPLRTHRHFTRVPEHKVRVPPASSVHATPNRSHVHPLRIHQHREPDLPQANRWQLTSLTETLRQLPA